MQDFKEFKLPENAAHTIAISLITELCKSDPRIAELCCNPSQAEKLGRGLAVAYFSLRQSLESGEPA